MHDYLSMYGEGGSRPGMDDRLLWVISGKHLALFHSSSESNKGQFDEACYM